MQDVTLSYIDDTDDAIEEHVNFLTGKNLHEVWPENNCLTSFHFAQAFFSKYLQPNRPQEVSLSFALFIFSGKEHLSRVVRLIVTNSVIFLIDMIHLLLSFASLQLSL